MDQNPTPPPGGDFPQTWGALLAGGQGRRMGGAKHLKEISGLSLAERGVEALGRVCPKVVVLTSRVADLAHIPAEILADRWPGQGPLCALATAFLDTPAPSLLLMAVDLPLVPRELLWRLARGEPGERALVPTSRHGREPLLAWYSRECLPPALRLIKEGERRMGSLLRMVQARILSEEETSACDPDGLAFYNVNYPEDLAEAERLLASRGRIDT